MASTGAMLLLLSSLSLQAMALQERAFLAGRQRQRGWDDQLMSAAQGFTGQLQRHHRCLLGVPAEQWAAAQSEPSACGSDGAATLPIPAAGVRLVAYCPELSEPPRAALVLELTEVAQSQRAAYQLALAAGETALAPLRVAGLQERGRLRGVTLPAPCPQEAP
ncbi:hypothetical protein [Cyanobium sp. PCC 7001]|uniref:hypothetical protein n=1 Tax=Cyanobium sp. PCC 7001 TaxID=180281 RepID=UPI0012E9CA41|nr:hypothetical protein [Cyanobium sp. PCC 7001]